MPNKYTRKAVNIRGNWTQEDLTNAIRSVVDENVAVRRAAIQYHVPRKTLERRIKTGNSLKGKMGPSSSMGTDHENRLSRHILTMQKRGFPLTRDDLRKLAYQFAEQLNLKHRFNKQKEKAGYDWLNLFLSRHPEISVRKSEGMSLARTNAMDRNEIAQYFTLLEATMEENDLFDKPAKIFNLDETGLQLNSRPGEVLAQKGSKAVSTVTSTERGETITLVACCNAEGNFLPPAIIMKGKNKKQEWEDGLPPGSILFMSEKSAYINSKIFLQWLRLHFIPRKPQGKVLLILDGHASHVNSVEMLEFAESNEIIILCLPSHTTQYLQPLDRSFFKPLKGHFYESCRMWLRNHAGRRITRYQFGELLSDSWGKAATTQNGSSGFRSTGIRPLNRDVIPDYAFHSEENNANPNLTLIEMQSTSITAAQPIVTHLNSHACCSTATASPDKITPSKILQDLSPPVPEKLATVKKRTKQLAMILTTPENLQLRKEKAIKMHEKNERVLKRKELKKSEEIPKKKKYDSSSSEEEEKIEIILESDDGESDDFDENVCVGCGENYNDTKKHDDWIQCVTCLHWLHENCTSYGNFCQKCGKLDSKSKKGKK